MYDFCIIGGGAIGCAIARELTRYKASVALVEAAPDVCTGSSGANSGIVHSGYDPKPGTAMAKYNALGSRLFRAYAATLDVPYKQTGSLTVATDPTELASLELLLERGRVNGIDGLSIISGDEARKLEPNLSDRVTAALYAPTAAVVNPFELTFALRENAEANGAEFIFDFRVVSAGREDDCTTLRAADGRAVSAKTVINCAGNGGGEVARMLGDIVRLSHRAGEYRMFDKVHFVGRPVFGAPTSRGKGVLVCPTADGNFFIGPTAVDVRRSFVGIRSEAFGELAAAANKIVKNLPYDKQITTFVGVRAMADTGDFMIGKGRNPNVYNVIGICSPGLSCVPAIAISVARSFNLEKRTDFNPSRHRIKRLCDQDAAGRKALIESDSDYGKIVCRCELVTEAEITEAVRRGARTVDGVKKRLRAGMGRCQGGFCMSSVINILSDRLGTDATEAEKDKRGSYILAKEEQ